MDRTRPRVDEPPTSARLPDRSLDPPAAPPVVALRSSGSRMNVFRKMVQGPLGPGRPNDGDLVAVTDADRRPLGHALWNSQSQIPVRFVWRGPEPPRESDWYELLDRAVGLRREALALDAVTDSYRVVHAEGDGLSGLIVDRFADVLSIELFSLGMYQRIGAIVDHLASRLGTSHFRVRVDASAARSEGFNPRAFDSPGRPPAVAIAEHGVRYRVHFEGSHKTGFFCDQRDNRLRLRSFTLGREVLDLCCYSGGFGLNARLFGGASEVTCVDLDEAALAMARDNANLNQTRLKLVHSDAFGYARQMIANGRRFGVVVLDPPKFIPTRADLPLGKRKYSDLNALALQLVEPGGFLVTCSCSGLLSQEEFLYLIRTASLRSGRSAQVLSVTGASADHPVRLDAPEGSYLKVVWLRVGDVSQPTANANEEDADD